MDEASSAALFTVVTAVSAGVILIMVSRRLGIPAIVLLLAGGVALGPYGAGFAQPASLGAGLRVLISILVGVILFEGGLTLDLRGYRAAPRIIHRMLSVGVMVTWLGTALSIYLLTDHGGSFSLQAASLVIVTGPTVVGPLLKRIRVAERVHSVLAWESVLIDPIGVFAAVFCFEWIVLQRGGVAVLGLAARVGTGLGIGIAGGWLVDQALRRRMVPDDMVGVGTLSFAVLLFGLAELIAVQAGLLSVICAGLVVGAKQSDAIKAVRNFKGEVTELAIGMLFILLSANLDLEQFARFGRSGLWIVGLVMFLVRPLAVLASTWGLDVSWRERAFLSWVAPRGIVAASMASLFALELARLGVPEARFVESFVYAVIVGTIVLQGLSAGPMARLLGLLRTTPRGWLIVGAHSFGAAIARFLGDRGVAPVLLVDLNRRYVRSASAEGLTAVLADAREPASLEHRTELAGIGSVLSLTANEDLNAVIARSWGAVVGEHNVFRWRTPPLEKDAEPGKPIWTTLPSPATIASELEHGDARLLPSTERAQRTGRPRHELLRVVDGRAELLPEAKVRMGAPADGAEVLLLERQAQFFLDALRDELVFELDADSPAELLEQMVARAAEHLPGVPVQPLLDELLERERALPSALGDGVAAPHAFLPALGRQVCILARVPRGLPWSPGDDQPVRLVLLLLSPADDHERHLALLADMARLFASPDLRRELLECELEAMVARLRRAHSP